MRHRRAYLVAVLLLAIFLRLAFIGSKSVWLDEAFAVWQAEKPPEEIWEGTNDNHPPLYYLMLKSWMALGDSETIIRIPSALMSLTSLSLLYVLARRFSEPKTAFVAILLLALAPIDIWYAQEARMVIFVIPAALSIALGLVLMGRTGGFLIFVGLALGLYLDYTIIPLWAVLSGLWFARWWTLGRAKKQLFIWLIASAGAWLVFIPLWPHLDLVLSRMGNIFIFANIRDWTGLTVVGRILPLLALIVMAIISGLVGYWAPGILSRQRGGRATATVSIILFVLLTALTPVPRLYSVKRLIVTGWPFVILGISWLTVHQAPRRRVVLASAAAVSFAAGLVTLTLIPKDDWRSAVAHINEHASKDDVVWIDPYSGNLPYNYYRPLLEAQFSSELLENPPLSQVWHIAERQPNRPMPGSEAEEWLDANRRILKIIRLYRLEVRKYAAPN